MSTDVQSVLAQQQLNDYGSLVSAIAISYDYCLTISREVAYIWKMRWTKVSTLFLLVRYIGLFSSLILALDGSTFMPGTVTVYLGGDAMYFIGVWTFAIFWVGADMVMILRVWAMYNRSRIILGILLVMYVAEIVILLVASGIYSDPEYGSAPPVQVLDIVVCGNISSTMIWNVASVVMQLILGIAMCILVICQFLKESLQAYRATGKWQLNRYMKLLVRDNLFYFLATLSYSLAKILGLLGMIPGGWVTQVFMVTTNIALYTLTPRFVMNVRELYVCDIQGRCDRDIDNGFGLASGARHGVGGLTSIGSIAFVEGGGNEGLSNGEEIATVEERGEGSRRQISVT